ncbi:hypothetical protein LCGC14_0636130 [marine sediment metagenome]|uniref:Transposase zinc-ribbon domain-containing protein n=1 Tax=marine sediment metagenome TaxID=412755 RepID=A0A0F9R0H4_9ZZZZ
MHKRCPRCKAKVKLSKLTGKYYCWECDIYYTTNEVIFYN